MGRQDTESIGSRREFTYFGEGPIPSANSEQNCERRASKLFAGLGGLAAVRPARRQAVTAQPTFARDRQRRVELHPVMRHLRRDPPALAAFQVDEAIAAMVRSVRNRLDVALPVIRASSWSEPGACSTTTLSRSRLPADSTLRRTRSR